MTRIASFAATLILAASATTHAFSHDAHDCDRTAVHRVSTETHAGHQAESSSEATAGDIVVTDFWARATLPNQKVGGGYMAITNNGETDDRLVSMTSPVSGEVEVHEMSMENDIMRMRPLEDGILIPAGETVELAPGGLHLMFQELEEGFVQGETVAVTLTFERAGDVTIELPVLAPGATGTDGHGHH
jgi:copper(I)-binding protein